MNMWPFSNPSQTFHIRKPINFLNSSILKTHHVFQYVEIIEFSTNMCTSNFHLSASKSDKSFAECRCRLQTPTGKCWGSENEMFMCVRGLYGKCSEDNFGHAQNISFAYAFSHKTKHTAFWAVWTKERIMACNDLVWILIFNPSFSHGNFSIIWKILSSLYRNRWAEIIIKHLLCVAWCCSKLVRHR